MRLSLDWLSEFVTWNETDPHIIAERLTLSTAEVEAVEEAGKFLHHCCVGKIVSVAQHPNADRLKLLEVETDDGTKRVVCGGTNLEEGILVAFAHSGATVKWHGGDVMTLEPAVIRGEESNGMVCAAEELGLEHAGLPTTGGERAVLNLSSVKGIKVGMSLKQALHQEGAVLDISNTAITTRPDLFSHIGFARECVALGLAKWKKTKPVSVKPGTTSPKFIVKNEAKDLVSRYRGCLVEIDSLGETPDWMVQRLSEMNVRSVSLPVDITNYVMFETGMPLHAFDADDFTGDISIRTSKKGESVMTLDNKERALLEGALVLSDKAGIFDLLGIMGGLRTSTKNTTKRLYLHAAVLSPIHIRRAMLATNHRTDAATMYEKGVPKVSAETGFNRALELMIQLIPGAKVASKFIEWGDNGEAPTIQLSTEKVRSVLGIDINDGTITAILQSLECTVKKGAKGILKVTPPLHRLRDLEIEVDLIEEIGRMHGYDALPVKLPQAELRIPERDRRLDTLRSALASTGFFEHVGLSLVSPKLLKDAGFDASHAHSLSNPIGEDTSLLHTSTLPSLLAHAQRNIRDCSETLKTFHTAHVFAKHAGEHRELSLLLTPVGSTTLLTEPLLILKRDLAAALSTLGLTLEVTGAQTPTAFEHPGRSGNVIIHGKDVGLLSELHPSIAKRFDLPARTAIGIINIDMLFALHSASSIFQAIPAFPAVTYDVTLERTHSEALGSLVEKLKKSHPLLVDIATVDLYAPKEKQTYNATLRFTYQAPDRTLTEDEAKKAHDVVIAAM